MAINIGLKDGSRKAVVEILNGTVSDLYVLYTKTRKFHWNVTGPHFNDLHKFFEGQYDQLDDAIDEVAERIRALGYPAPGSLAEFLKSARLKEQAKGELSAAKMVKELLEDHEAVVRQLRKDVDETAKLGDAGTSDFLTGLMEDHEKMAWMLRSIAND
jgi:starvation-inducible DNA-binding protein